MVLYTKSQFGLSDHDAFILYGILNALVYLTPAIGGYLADNVIVIKRTMVLGMFLEGTGLATLSFPHWTMFYTGLTLVIIGVGFFKTGPTNLLARAYNDTHRIKVDELNREGRDPLVKKRPIAYSQINPEAIIRGDVKSIYTTEKPVEAPTSADIRDKIHVPQGPPNKEKIDYAIADIYVMFTEKQKKDPGHTKTDLIDYLKAYSSMFMQHYGLTSNEFEMLIKRIEEGKD